MGELAAFRGFGVQKKAIVGKPGPWKARGAKIGRVSTGGVDGE